MNIICPVCENKNFELIYKNYPGYLEGSFYQINKCLFCDSHFIVPEDDVKKIYDIIYSNVDTFGYDRYYMYSKVIKDKQDPLKFLAYSESTYYPVYQYLKNRRGLNILEVGCGYGYLTYALYKNGFTVKGLDIASNAIDNAKKNFGDFFYNMDIKEFVNETEQKFDLIIATELIEHTKEPYQFLFECTKVLKENGKIIITTPNKDYYKSESIWQTDLPPVHIFWIGKKGIKILAEKLNLDTEFYVFTNYYSKSESRLINYFRSRKEIVGRSSLTREGKPVQFPRPPLLEMVFVQAFNRISLLRFVSNIIHNLLIGTENTLCVFFEKKKFVESTE